MRNQIFGRALSGTAAVALVLVMGTAAKAAPGDDLDQLIEESWQYALSQSPVFASQLDVAGYEGKVSDPSLEAQTSQADKAKEFLQRLEAIDETALTPEQKVNYGILRRTLNETIQRDSFGQRVINFTNRSGWHQNFASMAINSPFRNAADYKSYVDRLAQYPQINDTNIAIADQAIAGGYTLPCDAMQGYEVSITGLIADDPKATRFYEPFTRPKPATMDQAEFDALAARTETIISDVLYPELREHADWYITSYAPACAVEPGVSAQPGGDAYYAFRIAEMTTTDLTADEIHNIGLSEVARIRAEMEEVAAEAGYESREAFIEHLRTDPKYYAKTPEELMEKVARVTKIIDGKMPTLFYRLPRLPYGIREIPAETAEGTTTAYYNPGSPDIGISGTYYVNTSKLDQRPFWEIPALSVHEAVPGHHHQIALQQELDMPDFRKYGAFFTAFVEGWGLYSERLGIEMGLYDTPAKNMGRLSYEMWRACRLVVDTGIHSKGWSKQQAVDFMLDNTALTAANIDAEVNRYISWPGQALAYKIGELKIRELRGKAEETLGDDFDLRAFHDTVLEQGAVPLDVLEAHVAAWIEAQRADDEG
ncbi:DUF885 domain-containing protein [Alterisphingorhabdus coralli]|uniref:DUF885 domain-containing protein n=1 Tax=Alterisphingorhabdus coralli TaxID=3071408 RepID=A0AA97F6N7_9SPHN|nr:DUF885 domain-containing protein [Parasphingorhabdus sp. SCSIO 66989]WOE74938.1 DUF885 domain-containing protein [Parasphingorhabdus sp. SCSIO 66989]